MALPHLHITRRSLARKFSDFSGLSGVFASVGVVALIVGFGAESLVSDLVTGVFVLIENQFNVGDIIEVDIPAPVDTDTKPQDIPLDIVYEDDYLIIINKPSGMVVHPGNGNYEHTLVNALIYHVKNLASSKKTPNFAHYFG